MLCNLHLTTAYGGASPQGEAFERSEILKKKITNIMFIVLLLLLSVLTLSKCSNMTDSGIKKNIIGIVKDNKEILIEAISTGNYDKIYDIKGIEDITINDACIVFYCKGKGIAPSSQEYGFYYSNNNLPIAIFDGKPIYYFKNDIAIGEGREYVDSSYNSFYTEKIIESFYYYDNNL